MQDKSTIINVKCPMCATTLVNTERNSKQKGVFFHKCSGGCKRLWRVDYATQRVTHMQGKEKQTPIKDWILDMETGTCIPALYETK